MSEEKARQTKGKSMPFFNFDADSFREHFMGTAPEDLCINRDGEVAAVAKALVVMANAIGYREITKKNMREIADRMLFWESLFGHVLTDSRTGAPIPIGLPAIEAHVGLTPRGTPLRRNSFLARAYRASLRNPNTTEMRVHAQREAMKRISRMLQDPAVGNRVAAAVHDLDVVICNRNGAELYSAKYADPEED